MPTIMPERLREMERRCLKGHGISRADAIWMMALPLAQMRPVLDLASSVRDHYQGNRINLCSIVNAKSRLCGEDCRFCAQSLHFSGNAPQYPLMSREDLVESARNAEASGATCFSIVTSGSRIQRPEEKETILEAVHQISTETSLRTCVSLGMLDKDFLERLQAAGLDRVHHNLETSERFFPSICTTHDYIGRLDMVRLIHQQGLECCTGGIIGLGESVEDRIDLAFQVRQLGAESIPINILNPIPGTPLEKRRVLEPDEVFQSIALFRLVNPKASIIIAGGRERSLGTRQEELYAAGASGILLGNYLTTLGRPAEEDLEMIHRLGLVPDTKNQTIYSLVEE